MAGGRGREESGRNRPMMALLSLGEKKLGSRRVLKPSEEIGSGRGKRNIPTDRHYEEGRRKASKYKGKDSNVCVCVCGENSSEAKKKWLNVKMREASF